jgi:hypothetical protein
MTDADYVKSTAAENQVAEEIERLSHNKLKIIFTGYGAGVPKKFSNHVPYDPNKPRPLDLEVEGLNVIIEVMASDRHAFANSRFFPVAEDKVERAKKERALRKRAFFVFVLNKETQPNEWWINAEKCFKYELEKNSPTIYGPQDIYKTDKNAWIRGLKSLVKELLESSFSS